jgi:TPR repeat protein
VDPRRRPLSRGFALPALGLAFGVAACVRGPVSIAPYAAPPPTCPLEGCDGARAARIASSHAPDACPGSGQSACGGASARQCAEHALAAWTDAEGDRQVACVARTLVEACGLGDPPACGYAGRLLLDGRGIARDVEQGVSLLTKACEADVATACLVAIRWLADEHNASQVDEGASLRSRLDAEYSCLTGAAEECYAAGVSFFWGRPPFPRDYVRAATEYRHGCDRGSGRACSNLGDAYWYENGVPRDVAHAVDLYARACHLGIALGCSNLGYATENGEGIARDAARARELYKEACAADDVYEDGPDGFARDEARSLAAMVQSCKLGYHYGCDWARSREEP